MPSTDWMSLRLSYRRADVAAFWILGTLTWAVVCALAASALGVRAPWIWGAGAGAAVLAPGLWSRDWFEQGIRAWNGTMWRLTAACRAYVLAVCYYLIFTAVGRGSSPLGLTRRDGEVSRWLPIDRTSWDASSGLAGIEQGYRGLNAYARHHGQWWTFSLWPVLLLLRLLRDEERDSAPPSSTYTLY